MSLISPVVAGCCHPVSGSFDEPPQPRRRLCQSVVVGAVGGLYWTCV